MCKYIVYIPASPCQQHDHYADINGGLNIEPHTQLIVIKSNLAVAMFLWSSNNLCQNVRLFYLWTTLRSSVIMTFSCKFVLMYDPVIVQYTMM